MNTKKETAGLRVRIFLIAGAALLFTGMISSLKLFRNKKKGSGKFLTSDGRLVEVDNKHSQSTGKKITIAQMKDWVKR